MGVTAGPWQPPDVITDEAVGEARQSMRDYHAGAETVDPDHLVDWLVDLCDGKAHGLDAKGLVSRCRALAEGVEDYPSRCFTRDTRKQLRRRFQFVPTDKELIDAIDEIDRADRETARRLMSILDIGPRRERRHDDGEPAHQRSDWTWSKAEAEAHGERLRERKRRENAELAAKIAADTGQPPVPTRAPGESDALFMARLKQHRDGVLDAATADFKRGRFGGLRPLGQFAGQRRSGDPALQARAEAMTARARAEADEREARIEGAAS